MCADNMAANEKSMLKRANCLLRLRKQIIYFPLFYEKKMFKTKVNNNSVISGIACNRFI